MLQHSHSNENHKTDINSSMKEIYTEKSNLNGMNCDEFSNGSVKLESTKINENSCNNHVEDNIKNEKLVMLKNSKGKTSSVPEISKDIKSKHGVSLPSKPSYHNKHVKHPLLKRKFVPVAAHLTNASAKVVLFERNVEIKDLESKVKYLQNKIKVLENENKTLQGVQSRQERELKRFKEGIADIPSLLRSHKEESKVYESALSNMRRELRDCQREIKIRNEALLKKESHIDKLNITLKRNEKNFQDISCELKGLKAEKKDLEEENKILLGDNESLKSENGDLQKKIKSMVYQMQNFEGNLMKEKKLNSHLREEMDLLLKKYEDMQNKVSIEEHILTSEKLVTSACMIEDSSKMNENPVKEDSPKKNENPIKEDSPKKNENSIKEVSSKIKENPIKEDSTKENSSKMLEDSVKENSLNMKEDSIKENSSIMSTEVSSKDNAKYESSKVSNSVTHESKEKIQQKEISDKTKDALIHTFKRYQDLCDTKQSSCAVKAYRIGTSNLKLLPPLKQTCRKYSQNIDSNIVSKERFSPFTDGKTKDLSKQWQSVKLAQYFQCKFDTNNYETPSSNNKIAEKVIKRDKYSDFDEPSKLISSESYLLLSQFDSS